MTINVTSKDSTTNNDTFNSGQLQFHKSLAKYYHGWYRDSLESIIYCEQREWFTRANEHRDFSKQVLAVILENLDAIEFFEVGDRAHLKDSALPVEFRGYK